MKAINIASRIIWGILTVYFAVTIYTHNDWQFWVLSILNGILFSLTNPNYVKK